MDKKTCMIVLVGIIFVVLLSKNNTLEPLTCNELQSQVTDDIRSIKHKMKHNNLTLNNLNTIDLDTTSLIKKHTPINKCYNKYIRVNNQSARELIDKKNHLNGTETVVSTHLNNIDLSLEKVNDSQVMYNKYSYDTVVWGIVTVGLLVTTLTIIM